MKNKLQIFIYAFLIIGILGCSEDEGLTDVSVNAPSNISADFTIKQDNSGEVTIFPSAEGANSFVVDFGDGSGSSEEFTPGNNVSHTYAEGNYQIGLTAKNITGLSSQATQELTVSFSAPENLEVTITKDAGNPFLVNVSASAENAASYEVYFGEDDAESPQALMADETISYTYTSTGLYTITVVALSGGTATTSYTEEVEIVDPLILPITFESGTVDYTFYNFGGGEGAGVPIIENPAPNDVNNSATVASYTKPAGSETWAGTSVTLNENIDFSNTTFVAVDVYSPAVGTPILFKIEKAGDNTVFVESTVNTTVANEWETLVFDLSAIDPAQQYSVMSMFFNFNTSGADETYYFDNIRTIQLELTKLPLTFESENLSYSWAGFGGASGSVIDNPDATGVNTSLKVTQLDKGEGAQTWGGISLNLDESLNFSSGTVISMKVWSPEAGVPILLKFEDSQSTPDGNGNPSVFVEVIQNTTTANAWEQLNFDLSSFGAFSEANSYDRAIVFYDFNNPGEGTTFYFDDIAFGEVVSTEPTAGAPIPDLPAENVISLFSETYTNVGVDTWRTDWSAAALEDVSVAGNPVKKYSNLDFVGIETTSTTVDASEMTYFHTDVWSADYEVFRVKLVDFGPNGVYDGGGDDVEHEIAFTDIEKGKWVSLDIPLSDFTGLTTQSNIAQLIYSGTPSGAITVYVDNVYFHN